MAVLMALYFLLGADVTWTLSDTVLYIREGERSNICVESSSLDGGQLDPGSISVTLNTVVETATRRFEMKEKCNRFMINTLYILFYSKYMQRG